MKSKTKCAGQLHRWLGAFVVLAATTAFAKDDHAPPPTLDEVINTLKAKWPEQPEAETWELLGQFVERNTPPFPHMEFLKLFLDPTDQKLNFVARGEAYFKYVFGRTNRANQNDILQRLARDYPVPGAILPLIKDYGQRGDYMLHVMRRSRQDFKVDELIAHYVEIDFRDAASRDHLGYLLKVELLKDKPTVNYRHVVELVGADFFSVDRRRDLLKHAMKKFLKDNPEKAMSDIAEAWALGYLERDQMEVDRPARRRLNQAGRTLTEDLFLAAREMNKLPPEQIRRLALALRRTQAVLGEPSRSTAGQDFGHPANELIIEALGLHPTQCKAFLERVAQAKGKIKLD
ncbi:MAG TPA: hypothetical protein VM901_13655 [Bdellovibrionota bacterium]|jgi:hypothetical protein|nr:hypothetical protein [Bdellovibrionota bacterium]